MAAQDPGSSSLATAAAGSAHAFSSSSPLSDNYEYDDDADTTAAAEHMLLGATTRPDFLAKARALMEDDDELVMADEAGGVGVLGDTLRG
eukprot:CAMPEP_0197610560 /NCGR_PEP_ID=MMETSP1326-20131121/53633_1 /TAXON_ID=1155430 /ORGANISM="Genus nov. species nov., Strain RCC2288" /LENGTH=89 /DNA_ID=CAMNT_0043179091 /DNA_START=23 /DNA_END=289 /DNA_ORIENTATION=+